MPTPTDPNRLVQSLEIQVDHLAEQLAGALALLHQAAVERHYTLHGGFFTACQDAQCEAIRARLAKYRPPTPPEAKPGSVYHLDGHQVEPEVANG